jgi:hypothetical protein
MRFLGLFAVLAAFACSQAVAQGQDSPNEARVLFAASDAAGYPAPIVSHLTAGSDGASPFGLRTVSIDDNWPPTVPGAANNPPNNYEDPHSAPAPPGAVGHVYQDLATGGLSRPVCDPCPSWGAVTFVGYDAFRGISDSGWTNEGIHAGANFGTKLGSFSDLTGIGFQLGGTIGVYDWSGTDYRPQDRNDPETQAFITYGFFHKPNEHSKWDAAVVQDWMLNDNFGVYAENPTLSQLRAQLGYAVNEWNEIGFWGTCRLLSSTRFVVGDGLTQWRPIDQVSLFWHYKWQPGGADTTIWIGLPEQDRLGGGSAIGDYIAGASANVPLNDWFGLYTLVTYMHPSGGAGPAAAQEDEWNFTIGVAFYPGRNARSTNVAGQCWMPDLPVANNGYFFVDTNNHD